MVRTGEPDWAERFGGPLAVALLAAEVSALGAHLNARSSAVRALAVDALLEDVSAVTVATRLGVSRQKVYDISRTKPVNRYPGAGAMLAVGAGVGVWKWIEVRRGPRASGPA